MQAVMLSILMLLSLSESSLVWHTLLGVLSCCVLRLMTPWMLWLVSDTEICGNSSIVARILKLFSHTRSMTTISENMILL